MRGIFWFPSRSLGTRPTHCFKLDKAIGHAAIIYLLYSVGYEYHTAMIMTVGAVPLWLPASEAGMSVFLRHLTAGTGQPRGDCPYGFLPVRIIAVGYEQEQD